MEDLELIRGLRLREDNAIETLYDLYGPDVYCLISNMKIGNASEFTIKTFESFAQSISDYDPKNQSLWSALMGHARIVTKKHRASTNTPSNLEDGGTQIDQSLINASYAEIIDRVFSKGMSLAEVTKYLNIPKGTARTRFRLAINSLKNKYNSDAGTFLSVLLISQLMHI